MSKQLTLLSLGAGVQSTALLIASAEGLLPRLDGAIFSDTGWEPREVYDHLNRLDDEVAKPAGIPIYRVSAGNIRDDALDPVHRFASMPLYILNKNGTPGMARRQCTSEYKIKPIKRQVRRLLGGEDLPNGSVGRVPKGSQAVQWIGISTDEFHRAKDSDVSYVKHHFPLLFDLNWSRQDCISYLKKRGWGHTPKSACVGCPFHGNRQWRELRDNAPEDFADAVAFDYAIRNGSARANADGKALLGTAFLHPSRVPLDQAPINRTTRRELLDMNGLLWEFEDDEELAGCSPFGCRADDMETPWAPVLTDDEESA